MQLGGFINANAVLPEDAPDDWQPGDPPWWPQEPEPDILPQNRNMCGGSLKIAEGTASVEIEYDDRGVRASAQWSAGGDMFCYARSFNVRPYVIDPLARPPSPMPFSMLCRSDLEPQGHCIEQLTEWVLELKPERLLNHRVLLPLPMPGGVEGAWLRALWVLREAAFEGKLSNEAAGWVIVDAFKGEVLVTGSDFSTALTQWQAEVARVRPRPPKPQVEEPREPTPEHAPQYVKDDEKKAAYISTGTIRLEMPALSELAWPIPLPQHVPAVAVFLPPTPAIPENYLQAGFTRVLRMFGEHGAVKYGIMREEADGFTLIGEGLLDVVDPATVHTEIQEALGVQRAFYQDMPEGFPNPFREKHPSETHVFEGWNNALRQREPLKHTAGSWGQFSARNIHGDGWAWGVVRVWM
jgi:hypothetical protein